MNRLYYSMLLAALVIIVLLILLSIYGAFLGSEQAGNFFNSPVLVAYWFVLGLMLIAGIVIFQRLWLIHFGCVLVLLGAMLGSDAGHALQQKLLGINKIHKGLMLIYQGEESNEVETEENGTIEKLPFSVRLKEFRVNYYEPERRVVRNYISSLAIIENGRAVAEKNVEVNHPMHYGGYYFYQHSYDAQGGRYSVLMVVPDNGLAFVYAGCTVLCVGAVGQFWLRNIFRKKACTPEA
jgi:cytochrome c biogenesis protein ResB